MESAEYLVSLVRAELISQITRDTLRDAIGQTTIGDYSISGHLYEHICIQLNVVFVPDDHSLKPDTALQAHVGESYLRKVFQNCALNIDVESGWAEVEKQVYEIIALISEESSRNLIQKIRSL